MKKFVCESLEEFILENKDRDMSNQEEDELEERDETVKKGLITPEDRKVMNKKTVSPYADSGGKEGADRWAKKYGAGKKGAYSAN